MELFSQMNFCYPAWEIGTTFSHSQEFKNYYQSRIESLFISWALGLKEEQKDREQSLSYAHLADPMSFLIPREPFIMTALDAYNSGEWQLPNMPIEHELLVAQTLKGAHQPFYHQ